MTLEDFTPDPDFGGKPKYSDSHAVIVHFLYYKDELDDLHHLDERLDQAINASGVGCYDGHEINLDMSDGTLYMYGPDASELFKVVKPVLESTDFTQNAWATLRFGGAIDAPEIEVDIKS
jgi:hypothetical protein